MPDEHPFSEHTEAIVRIQEHLKQNDKEMDAFHDRLQQSVKEYAALCVEFAKMQGGLAAMAQTLGRIEGTLGEIRTQVSATNGRVGKLETASAVQMWTLRLAGAALLPLYGIAIKQLFGG